MSQMTLAIGDKNLSTWSLRPWLALTQAGIPFEELNIKLDVPGSRKVLQEKSPSGLVPFLIDETDGRDVKIWDSLAIVEYANERFPEKNLWPSDPGARAHARAVTAEMHSGFGALRTVWPMMFTREGLQHTTSGGVQKDIDRIEAIWTECRTRFGAGGDFLFGAFSIADAFYAPVVSRFKTYGPLTLNATASAYAEAVWALPSMQAWGDGARAELESQK